MTRKVDASGPIKELSLFPVSTNLYPFIVEKILNKSLITSHSLWKTSTDNQQVEIQEHKLHTLPTRMAFTSVQINLDNRAIHIRLEDIDKKWNNFL